MIPQGWNESLENGDPKPLLLYLDGGDINTADAVEGSVRQSLGDFQLRERDRMIENLPDEVIELGKQLQLQVRKRFVSMMEMWSVEGKRLYNPKSRVIDYRCARNYRTNFAIAHSHADGVHYRARARIRNALPIDDHCSAAA